MQINNQRPYTNKQNLSFQAANLSEGLKGLGETEELGLLFYKRLKNKVLPELEKLSESKGVDLKVRRAVETDPNTSWATAHVRITIEAVKNEFVDTPSQQAKTRLVTDWALDPNYPNDYFIKDHLNNAQRAIQMTEEKLFNPFKSFVKALHSLFKKN